MNKHKYILYTKSSTLPSSLVHLPDYIDNVLSINELINDVSTNIKDIFIFNPESKILTLFWYEKSLIQRLGCIRLEITYISISKDREDKLIKLGIE